MSIETTGTAQITLQVCLKRALFTARYRGNQIEAESVYYKANPLAGPSKEARRDLVLRGAILRNVVAILKQRLELLDRDIAQIGKSDLEGNKPKPGPLLHWEVEYSHPTFNVLRYVTFWAPSAEDAIREFAELVSVCGLEGADIRVLGVKRAND